MPAASRRRSWIPVWLVAAAAFAFALQLAGKGLSPIEEGSILAEAEEIRQGRVLYRDIPEPVTPGIWYVTVWTLELAGPDLNATRVLMAALFALTAGVVFAACRSVASNGHALAGVAFLVAQRVLAFPLGSFVFYTEFAIFFVLLCVLALLRSADGTRRGWLFLAGLSLALCALFKQNIGAALWLGAGVYALTRPRRGATLAWIFAPATLLCALVAVYFASLGALGAMFQQLVIEPFTSFYPTNRIPYLLAFSPAKSDDELFFFLPGPFAEAFFLSSRTSRSLVRGVEALTMLLYLAPILIGGALAVRAARRRKLSGTELALATGAFACFAGVFPRSDFVHLIQALVGFVPLGVYLSRESRWALGSAGGLLAAVSLLAGVVLWTLPVRVRFEHPRARIELTPAIYNALSGSLEALERYVPRREPVAILPAGGIWYFLSGRRVPLGSALVLPYNQARDGGRGFAEKLRDSDVRRVVLMENRIPGIPPLPEYAPALDAYLRREFEEYASAGAGRMRFLRRRISAGPGRPPPG
jgi:hypothetical protein